MTFYAIVRKRLKSYFSNPSIPYNSVRFRILHRTDPKTEYRFFSATDTDTETEPNLNRTERKRTKLVRFSAKFDFDRFDQFHLFLQA